MVETLHSMCTATIRKQWQTTDSNSCYNLHEMSLGTEKSDRTVPLESPRGGQDSFTTGEGASMTASNNRDDNTHVFDGSYDKLLCRDSSNRKNRKNYKKSKGSKAF